MAMAVNDCLTFQFWQLEAFHLLRKEFTKRIGLFTKALGILVVREKIWHFVAEHGQAAWLQHYNRNTGSDLGTEGQQNLFEETLSPIQHSKIIKRPAATERFLWNGNSKACGFKDDSRGLRSLGKEI